MNSGLTAREFYDIEKFSLRMAEIRSFSIEQSIGNGHCHGSKSFSRLRDESAKRQLVIGAKGH